MTQNNESYRDKYPTVEAIDAWFSEFWTRYGIAEMQDYATFKRQANELRMTRTILDNLRKEYLKEKAA